MSALVALLKAKDAVTTTKNEKKSVENSIMEKKVATETVVISPNVESLDFHISEEELKIVRESVVQIDTTDKTREQIVIGMFGGIKNPRTGKRFVIPGVDYSSDDYIYQYAEMMRTLVNRPDDFKKIMNWE